MNHQNFHKKHKTLKNKINEYILKKQDICCEDDIDRKIIIQQIIEKYKKVAEHFLEPDDYLDYINNDLVKFIGYKVNLKKNKDIQGLKLWNEIDKKMYKDKMLNEEKIEHLLNNVPLYYLLAFLGYASYKAEPS